MLRTRAARLLSALALISTASTAACGDDGATLADAGPPVDADPNRPDADCSGQGGGVAGSGNFSAHVIDGSRYHGQGIDIIDIDDDADLDVVVGYSSSDTIIVYLNECDVGAWTPVNVSPGQGIVAMGAAVADYDNDGDLDIASMGLFERSGGFGTAGEVTWFENAGTPADSWARHDITGFTFYNPRAIDAADLNGDFRPDIVVSSINLGTGDGDGVYWFRNSGGAFSDPIPIDADLAYVPSMQIADIDGNGLPDVVAAGRDSGELVWYQNGGGDMPSFTRRVIASALSSVYAVYAANMDEDPDLEVVATHQGGLVYYDHAGDPARSWAERSIAAMPGGDANDSRLFAADLDGDGATDVALSAKSALELHVYVRDGAGWTDRLVASGIAGSFLSGGDLDGGGVDLVTSTYDDPGDGDPVTWWQNVP